MFASLEVLMLPSLTCAALITYLMLNRVNAALILCPGKDAPALLQDLADRKLPPRQELLGYISTDSNEEAVPSRFRLAAASDLLQQVKRHKVHTILVAAQKDDLEVCYQQLLDCKLNGVNIISFPGYSKSQGLK